MKIIINGAQGRMGKMAHATLAANLYFEVVAAIDQQDDLAQTIKDSKAQIVLDFTHADSVYQNALTIIKAGVHPVIGSTGLTDAQLIELQGLCQTQKLGGIIAPNFSIGAVLMAEFSQKAAHYFQQVEIIEAHHVNKRDAPSGTAINTAKRIAAIRQNAALPVTTTELFEGARGATVDSIPIHSMRLPGVLAAQQVIFGGAGETLTLSHNTISLECYQEGIILACKTVSTLSHLVYGLESILL
jgi:4-hydroxy-tetrahydrodipicolinate reductase